MPQNLTDQYALNLTDLIYDLYDIYHTESLQNAFDDIDELIAEKSASACSNDLRSKLWYTEFDSK